MLQRHDLSRLLACLSGTAVQLRRIIEVGFCAVLLLLCALRFACAGEFGTRWPEKKEHADPAIPRAIDTTGARGLKYSGGNRAVPCGLLPV